MLMDKLKFKEEHNSLKLKIRSNSHKLNKKSLPQHNLLLIQTFLKPLMWIFIMSSLAVKLLVRLHKLHQNLLKMILQDF